MASTLIDLNRAKSISQRLRLLSKLGFRDFLPVSPAVAEYSTGLRMGDTAEQMAKPIISVVKNKTLLLIVPIS